MKNYSAKNSHQSPSKTGQIPKSLPEWPLMLLDLDKEMILK